MSILLNLFCIYNSFVYIINGIKNNIFKEEPPMPISKNELTKEMIEKAMQCKTAEDLMALAKAEGVAITKDEAEAYMAELADVELDGAALKKIAGGDCYAVDGCMEKGCNWHF